MIRPQSVATWMQEFAIREKTDIVLSDYSALKELVAYTVKLEKCIDGAVWELHNLYPNNETVKAWLRGEK